MKELLDKISSYNIFNYLLPGTLFAAFVERFSDHKFPHGNIVVELFAFYFAGLVISRIGSLVVGPTLQKTKFIRFSPYGDFIRASTHDPKIELFSEQNNMYRTLCALFVALPAFKGADWVAKRLEVPHDVLLTVASGLLCVLFAFAYRKQTQFIKKRVDAALHEHR
jgi:hypothetical protein